MPLLVSVEASLYGFQVAGCRVSCQGNIFYFSRLYTLRVPAHLADGNWSEGNNLAASGDTAGGLDFENISRRPAHGTCIFTAFYDERLCEEVVTLHLSFSWGAGQCLEPPGTSYCNGGTCTCTLK